MKYFWILILVITITSCNQNKTNQVKNPDSYTDNKTKMIPVEPDGGIGDGALSIVDNYIQRIEKAHKKSEFLKYKAVSFNINIFFGGKQRLNGKITMLTNSSKIRIDKKDKSILIYDGEKVFLHPEGANDRGARFDMFTWTYFFGLPYKLNDPGTKWELGNDKTLGNVAHHTAKLTFESGTGDTPDDWYVVYTDPVTNTLKAAAYIVTFGSGGDTTKAESDPHAIYYKGFETIDGIQFATKWDFYGWTQEEGMKEKIGEASITDIVFFKNEEAIFEIPENSKEIKL